MEKIPVYSAQANITLELERAYTKCNAIISDAQDAIDSIVEIWELLKAEYPGQYIDAEPPQGPAGLV